MKISVKTNIKDVTRGMSRIQRKQIPFAASQTLNQLAFDLTKRKAKGVLGEATATTFDKKRGKGSTPFTQRNFFFEKSTKKNLTAFVFWDIRNADYMRFQVKGGVRSPRSKAIVVPTKNSKKHLNAFGNFKKGAVTEMLRDKSKYFSGSPLGAKGGKSEGIWERYGRSTKRGGQKVRKVASYTQSARYSPRFPFVAIVQRSVSDKSSGFNSKFRENLRRALATAKK
tara:strand:- start:89 stop:766 length:678 start_codon:yes stop_codon:yes gene_type:complete